MIGLEITNDSGQLAVHADSLGMACLGRATFLDMVQPTAQNTGYSRYSFNTTVPVVWAIDMPIGWTIGIRSSTFDGSQYIVTIHCGSGNNGWNFQTQAQVAVWAFAEGSNAATPSNFGLTLYDGSGNITHSLSAANATFPAVAASYESGNIAIPSMVRPVLVGGCSGYSVLYQFDSESNRWWREDTIQLALRSSANVVGPKKSQRFRSGLLTASGSNSEVGPKGYYFIYEGAGLP